MRFEHISIRHFRSIHSLDLKLDRMNALCGPNGCGKSNVLKAIIFAFKQAFDLREIYENMSSWQRDKRGGPGLSIYVEIVIAECSSQMAALAGVTKGSNVTYKFRVKRKGEVERKLGKKSLSSDDLTRLLEIITVVYIPPIRDIMSGGIEPFRTLLRQSLQRGRGELHPDRIHKTIVSPIEKRSKEVLPDLLDVTKAILGSSGVAIETENIKLSDLCDRIGLDIRIGTETIPLENLGTGHQSAVVIDLFRQFGEQFPGQTIYLFEEPDNHLHPTVMNAVIGGLQQLSGTSQVIMTTHSPILLRRVGFKSLVPLRLSDQRRTEKRQLNLASWDDRKISITLDSFGLKAIEPLLCRRIVVTEGSTDVIALETLLKLRRAISADELDLMIVSAGGKSRVYELCRLLDDLDVEWMAVLDFDAVYSGEPAILNTKYLGSRDVNLTNAIAQLLAAIDQTYKRGTNVLITLANVQKEIDNGHSPFTFFDGSILMNMMQLAPLSSKDEQSITSYLKNGNVRNRRELLAKYHIFLWKATLEEALLFTTDCENIVEAALIRLGKLSQALTRNRRKTLINKLHKLANEPLALSQVIEDLESNAALRRSELHAAVEFITNRLL